MSKKASAFKTWFVAQHGNRPSTETLDELMRQRNSVASAAAHAQRLVEQCQDYDNREQSALYAMNAFGPKRERKS